MTGRLCRPLPCTAHPTMAIPHAYQVWTTGRLNQQGWGRVGEMTGLVEDPSNLEVTTGKSSPSDTAAENIFSLPVSFAFTLLTLRFKMLSGSRLAA